MNGCIFDVVLPDIVLHEVQELQQTVQIHEGEDVGIEFDAFVDNLTFPEEAIDQQPEDR